MGSMNIVLGANDVLLDLPDDLIDRLIEMARQDNLSLEEEIKKILGTASGDVAASSHRVVDAHRYS